jgi:hypothetical protein
MSNHSMSLEDARRRVRQAWYGYVRPAYASHDPATLLAALVVASAGLDEILLAEDRPGATAAERLRNAHGSFSDYAGLRLARKTRHQAVHRLGYPICRRTALPALASYARALLEHGVDLSSPCAEERGLVLSS